MSTYSTVILDTNVVLDCFVFRNEGCRGLANAALSGGLVWLSSRSMRDELAYVLGRGLGERWSTVPAEVLTLFDHHARLEAEPSPSHLVCSDASDQVFIDLAVACRATLLTRDRALLKLNRRAALRGAAVQLPEHWCRLGT